jgi:hypothetical protein
MRVYARRPRAHTHTPVDINIYPRGVWGGVGLAEKNRVI